MVATQKEEWGKGKRPLNGGRRKRRTRFRRKRGIQSGGGVKTINIGSFITAKEGRGG